MNYIKFILAYLICASFISKSFAQSERLPQLGKDKISSLISAMTLEEKVNAIMLLGFSGQTPGVVGATATGLEKYGVPPVTMADGPAGLRINPNPVSGSPRYCTAFPTATALAATWNLNLMEAVGKNMGNEVREYGVEVLFAPAMNIQRNVLGGRNYEYYSEDPLLSGKMGASFVNGLQSEGVGASVKHFAANNQEKNRMSYNAVISQKALREIYLRGFEIAIKESQPKVVMSSYNKLNGVYTAESYDLITTVLRMEWGFKGAVITDYLGGKDFVAQMKAGNDMIMPGGNDRIKPIIDAVHDKSLDEKVINENVSRTLELSLNSPRFKKVVPSMKPDLSAHAKVSRDAAIESMVLLKNDNSALPVKNAKTIALYGKTSYDFIAGGRGSGEVNYEHAVSLKEALENEGFAINQSVNNLYSNYLGALIADTKPTDWIQQKFIIPFSPELSVSRKVIEQNASESDFAIITIGRSSSEGWDRHDSVVFDGAPAGYFRLSEIEKSLIRNVSEVFHAAGKKVVVVLNIGGATEVASWNNYPDAIICAWHTGQEGAAAFIRILKGIENPSGKLPISFPVKYTDDPSSVYFPGEPKENPVNSFYSEGIYVGYRYYNTFNVPVTYEFGFGLSYTSFGYSDLKLSSDTFKKSLNVTLTITNTGSVAGKEVVQLYLAAPNKEIDKPVRELKGFVKTRLLYPGESQSVTFTLDGRSLASFWSGISAWVAEKGTYEIQIGSSSKDIRKKAAFELPEQLIVEKVNNVLYPNELITDKKP